MVSACPLGYQRCGAVRFEGGHDSFWLNERRNSVKGRANERDGPSTARRSSEDGNKKQSKDEKKKKKRKEEKGGERERHVKG